MAERLRAIDLQTPWFQAEGSADELLRVIDHYNHLGIPFGITMAFGEGYVDANNPSGRIHHMVSLLHLDGEWACIVDNNFVGERYPKPYMWITRDELRRRIVDGRAGWVVVFLKGGSFRLPTVATPFTVAVGVVLGAFGLGLAMGGDES